MIGSRTIAKALRAAASWVAPSDPTPAYEGATQGRRLGRWQASAEGINSILFASADILRARSRDMARKNPWAQQARNRRTSNAIGTGIKPQSLHPDKAVRRQIHTKWRRWVKESDAHGVTNFYGQQAMVSNALFEAGEVFARFRPRLAADGLSVPLQLQLIEAEHVPLNLNIPGQNGNVVRAGIEFDRLGRRVAYHMYREHPGDATLLGNPNQLVRVPASEVLHVFEPLRPGQIRGIPMMAGVLLRLYEFDQYEDAELVRNKDAAMFSGFVRDDPQYLAAMADGAAPDKMMPTKPGTDAATGDGIELLALEAGT
ncbi:MAG TPA: phage portal protein, partial [Reyranella sp.]|nr:phage portal protein [Reyranella sp.]